MTPHHNITHRQTARHVEPRIRRHAHLLWCTALLLSSGVTSCIEPPLLLPGEEVMVDLPIVLTDMEVVWNVDVDWMAEWHYGWDVVDEELWGKLSYPEPTNYEVRRYFLGDTPGAAHSEVEAFTIHGTQFRRYYNFGYYDMLLWSNIDATDGTQAVLIDESDIDEVTASTSGSRGLRGVSRATGATNTVVAGLYNQPEIFYSAYPRDIYISRYFEDYDYFDEAEQVWVKKINTTLTPLVYTYLVQIIIINNHGRIVDANGNNAITGFASSTSVNTGHTGTTAGMLYFESRMKHGIDYKGQTADVIGGRFTTYGLCDMTSWAQDPSPIYSGSRTDIDNELFFDLTFSNGVEQTCNSKVTDQCRSHCHGGIITVVLDADDIDRPDPGEGTGSLFVPTVEDYDEVVWDATI